MNRHTFVLEVITDHGETTNSRALALELALCLARCGVVVERIKPVAFVSLPPDLDAEAGKEIPNGR
jgi:hypothetical protein